MPVPKPVCSKAKDTAPMGGCDVRPDMPEGVCKDMESRGVSKGLLSMATSTTSAPAAAAAIMLAVEIPAVSCECTWIGISGYLARILPTSLYASKALREGQPGPGGSCDIQLSSLRLEQTGHVLDAQDVNTFSDDLIHEVKVIVEGVLSLGLARDVATVANDSFDHTTGLLSSVNAEFHLQKVQHHLSNDRLSVPYILCGSAA